MSLRYGTDSQHGYSLVEIMVAICIGVIGLTGMAGLLMEAERTTQDSGGRSLAIWMIEDLTNRIRANAVAVDAYDTAGNAVSCANPPAARCADYYSAGAPKTGQICSGINLAAFDLWDIACSDQWEVSGSVLTRHGMSNFIARPQLNVTVTDVDNSKNVRIQLQWDSRTRGQDANGNMIYIAGGTGSNQSARLVSEFVP